MSFEVFDPLLSYLYNPSPLLFIFFFWNNLKLESSSLYDLFTSHFLKLIMWLFKSQDFYLTLKALAIQEDD